VAFNDRANASKDIPVFLDCAWIELGGILRPIFRFCQVESQTQSLSRGAAADNMRHKGMLPDGSGERSPLLPGLLQNVACEFPSLRGGGAAPIKQMQRYLRMGAARERQTRVAAVVLTSPAAPIFLR
jgi:hypothetical protein